MNKRKDWIADQAQRRANIPYPTEAVVYERASINPYWESRRLHALERVPTMPTIMFPDESIE